MERLPGKKKGQHPFFLQTGAVAISNERIIACQDGEVTFRYRDRSDGDRRKTETVPATTFIGRFLTHVLPSRFTRIRHYGFLSNRYRNQNLEQIRKLLGVRPAARPVAWTAAEWLQMLLGIDPLACPWCGGRLQEREEQPRPTSQPNRRCVPRRAAPCRTAAASRGPPGGAP